MTSLHERIADRHIDVLAYSRGLESASQRRVRALSKEVAAVLAGVDLSRLSRRQINALITRVAKAIDSTYVLIGSELDRDLVAMMTATTPSLARMVGSRKRTGPAIEDVLVLGATTSELWATSSSSVKRAVSRSLRMAVVTEQRDATESLFARGGVLDKAARDARANTQLATLSAETAVKKAMAADSSLIAGYRFSSMFDSKTCLKCAAMDGELFDRDMVARNESVRQIGAAPLHHGCRCVMVPELPEEGPASAIPGPDGKVSRGMTFEEWISKKSKRYQEAYFGRGRYELWQKGEITLSDLINGQGRIITLDELRRKYGD